MVFVVLFPTTVRQSPEPGGGFRDSEEDDARLVHHDRYMCTML